MTILTLYRADRGQTEVILAMRYNKGLLDEMTIRRLLANVRRMMGSEGGGVTPSPPLPEPI